ncbi:MAG: antitoxin component YwqK of YwqJK toxin-antitoxin module [Spirosomataceae bacterium]|jgi:antitoxin component YwqK of YwqJK toxin-antitoxin module
MSFFRDSIKVHQALFAKVVLLLLVGNTLLSCQNGNSIVIDHEEYPKEQLELKPLEGKWYASNKPLNGFAVTYFPNGKLSEKTGFHEGKRQGISQNWYENGQLRYEVFYQKNRKHGITKNWNPEGTLISESNFVDGVVHGVQTQWYPSGKIFKRMNIVNGIEEGLQQTWWENGKLYVNYEAKNGRIFGLKRSALCYELKNEVVQK